MMEAQTKTGVLIYVKEYVVGLCSVFGSGVGGYGRI
jgi:hypothetical protein